MAFGQHFITPTVLDTASDPDDTSIFAAQGAGQVAYIRWLMITVETPQSGSKIVIENGAGGAGVIAVASTATDTFLFSFPHEYDGPKFSANTAINATIEGATGVVATVSGQVYVRSE